MYTLPTEIERIARHRITERVRPHPHRAAPPSPGPAGRRDPPGRRPPGRLAGPGFATPVAEPATRRPNPTPCRRDALCPGTASSGRASVIRRGRESSGSPRRELWLAEAGAVGLVEAALVDWSWSAAVRRQRTGRARRTSAPARTPAVRTERRPQVDPGRSVLHVHREPGRPSASTTATKCAAEGTEQQEAGNHPGGPRVRAPGARASVRRTQSPRPGRPRAAGPTVSTPSAQRRADRSAPIMTRHAPRARRRARARCGASIGHETACPRPHQRARLGPNRGSRATARLPLRSSMRWKFWWDFDGVGPRWPW